MAVRSAGAAGRSSGRRVRACALVLALVAVFVAGLVSAPAPAAASSPGASPGADKVVLRARLDERPRQPQPVHRRRDLVLRDLAAQLRLPRRLLAGRPAKAHASPVLGDVSRRPPWTFHLREGRDSGRTASPSPRATWPSRYNYIVEKKLTRLLEPHEAHRGGRGHRRPHGGDPICSRPKANMTAPGSPSCPSTSGARSIPRPPDDVSQPAAHRRLRTSSRSPRSKKGELRQDGQQSDLLGRWPTVDEILFETYQNSDTMAQDLKLGGSLDAAWGIPSAQFANLEASRRPRGASPTTCSRGTTWRQLLRGAQPRQPHPQGREVPAGPELGDRPAAIVETSPGVAGAPPAPPS